MDSTRLSEPPVLFQKLTDFRNPRGVRFPFSTVIDGKTCCQGLDEHGDPEILLNVFLHDPKLAISVLRLCPDNDPILRAKNEKVQWNTATSINIHGF